MGCCCEVELQLISCAPYCSLHLVCGFIGCSPVLPVPFVEPTVRRQHCCLHAIFQVLPVLCTLRPKEGYIPQHEGVAVCPAGPSGLVDHGVHAFIVPLRDEAGRCLPGVEIHDCGYKVLSELLWSSSRN
jgi:hypothetical protein